jgi:ABC-2 type transport system permease protein
VVGCGVALAAGLIGIVTGLGVPDVVDGRVLARLAVLAALSGLLALPVALPASIGRGYLAAIGGLMVLIVAAQVAIVAGAGTWWPWSVAALWAMGSAGGIEPVAPAWLAVVPLVAALGASATVAWWRHAEVV